MSRDKQIEEMALDMCLIDRCKHLPQAECHNTTCAHCEAEALYEAGYRKQSEGEWVIKGGYFQKLVCTACGGVGVTTTKFCPNCGAKMYNKTLDRAKMKGENNE